MEFKHWRTLPKLEQVNAVNVWINSKVRYTEDRDAFGVTEDGGADS